jgi:GT2 family glycosyltransferase
MLSANKKRVNVSICICTRKRKEGLKKLLDSFEKMQAPPDTNIRIIVVENDLKNFSEYLINEFSLKSKFRISYYLETRQGVVFARNRSVEEADDCDFCCFTDDDQIVSSDWLIELMKCQHEFNADGVAGPTFPVFNKEVRAYIKDFHTPANFHYGTIVSHAYTGCLLIRKKYLDMLEGPFEIRLNFTGGEDSYLTFQITNLGGIIRFNPNAIAYEIIPESRSTLKYVIKRKFMTSNSALLIISMTNKNFTKISALIRLVMRFFYGLLIIIPFFIFGKANKLKGLLKIINAAGEFAFILGRTNQSYK